MLRNFLTKGAGTLAAGAATALGQPHLAVPASLLASNLADKGITLLANHKFSFGKKKYSPREIIKKALQIRSGVKKPLKMIDSMLESEEDLSKWKEGLSGWRADDWWDKTASKYVTENTTLPKFKKIINDIQKDVWHKALTDNAEFVKLFKEYAYPIPEELYKEIIKEKQKRFEELSYWSDVYMDNDYISEDPVKSKSDFDDLVERLYKDSENIFAENPGNNLEEDYPGKSFKDLAYDNP